MKIVKYLADATVYVMLNIASQKLHNEMNVTHFNIGTGVDLTILDLAEVEKEVVSYSGAIL